jgi:cytolysin-activating lysine-acyltransferase
MYLLNTYTILSMQNKNQNKKDQGILLSLAPQDRHRLIGEITSLLICSELHRKYLVNDIGAVFLPPINLDQFRIYKLKEEPIALVTWAYLTEKTEKKYLKGDYSLTPEDWNAGDRGWIIDFLAPFGHAKHVTRDLKNNIFPDQVGKAIRMDVNGNVKGIYKLHGKNVAKEFKNKKKTPPLKCERN